MLYNSQVNTFRFSFRLRCFWSSMLGVDVIPSCSQTDRCQSGIDSCIRFLNDVSLWLRAIFVFSSVFFVFEEIQIPIFVRCRCCVLLFQCSICLSFIYLYLWMRIKNFLFCCNIYERITRHGMPLVFYRMVL